MKKRITSLILTFIIFILPLTTYADDAGTAYIASFDIYKDNTRQNYNYAPIVINGKTYLCLTDICSSFNIFYKWDQSNNRIILSNSPFLNNNTNKGYKNQEWCPTYDSICGIQPYSQKINPDNSFSIYLYEDSNCEENILKYFELLKENNFSFFNYYSEINKTTYINKNGDTVWIKNNGDGTVEINVMNNDD